MKHRLRLGVVILAGIVATTHATIVSSAETAVDYPAGYRSWQHTKSMIIQPGHPLEDPFGGIHHIYANASALHGLSSGRYEDGAVFVFDLLDYNEAGNVIVEADRKRLDVMQYDRSRFADTGGWGYTTFVADSSTQLDQDVTQACHACHTSVEASNYVFSTYRR